MEDWELIKKCTWFSVVIRSYVVVWAYLDGQSGSRLYWNKTDNKFWAGKKNFTITDRISVATETLLLAVVDDWDANKCSEKGCMYLTCLIHSPVRHEIKRHGIAFSLVKLRTNQNEFQNALEWLWINRQIMPPRIILIFKEIPEYWSILQKYKYSQHNQPPNEQRTNRELFLFQCE